MKGRTKLKLKESQNSTTVYRIQGCHYNTCIELLCTHEGHCACINPSPDNSMQRYEACMHNIVYNISYLFFCGDACIP